jgi:predicted transcriptional regulator
LDLVIRRLESIRDTLAHQIEVEDLEINSKVVYVSMREAAKAIDCTVQAISVAFKKAEAKGINHILIKKKRYKIIRVIS